MNRVVKRGVLATALAGAALTVTAPAQAAPPEFPHGVGVCMAQVAISPETTIGAKSLGDFIRTGKGAGPKAFVEDLRGDGPGGCGAPPGPGHL